MTAETDKNENAHAKEFNEVIGDVHKDNINWLKLMGFEEDHRYFEPSTPRNEKFLDYSDKTEHGEVEIMLYEDGGTKGVIYFEPSLRDRIEPREAIEKFKKEYKERLKMIKVNLKGAADDMKRDVAKTLSDFNNDLNKKLEAVLPSDVKVKGRVIDAHVGDLPDREIKNLEGADVLIRYDDGRGFRRMYKFDINFDDRPRGIGWGRLVIEKSNKPAEQIYNNLLESIKIIEGLPTTGGEKK